jgi:hypothetical protein
MDHIGARAYRCQGRHFWHFWWAAAHHLTLSRRAGRERADAYDGLDRKLNELNIDQGMTPVPRPGLMNCTGVADSFLNSLPKVIG